ncbi:MAG: hypothetical protein HQ518_23380 [Rhodopirellula sp.]|nr:hypothetical protein [Rhodopirellula sp.]
MEFKIRYYKSAKDEHRHLRETYGTEFARTFDQWLLDLRSAAERGERSGSLDAFEVFTEIIEGKQSSSAWKESFRRFARESLIDQIKTIYTVLKKRCPPYEFRMSTAWFHLLDFIPAEIQAYYFVDHTEGQIIFSKFELCGLDEEEP